ncbi:hypothetical protein QQ045_007722 [Rhodiola kirilowii]
MSIPILSAVFFPPPSSIFITAMSFISVVSLANTGLSEIRGKHLQYSKFWNANVAKSSPLAGIKLSGRAVCAIAGGLFVKQIPASVRVRRETATPKPRPKASGAAATTVVHSVAPSFAKPTPRPSSTVKS